MPSDTNLCNRLKRKTGQKKKKKWMQKGMLVAAESWHMKAKAKKRRHTLIELISGFCLSLCREH